MDTLAHVLDSFKLKKKQSKYELYYSREGGLSVLLKNLGFNLGAEVGADTGRYSKCLLAVNRNLKLYAIDEWKEAFEGTYSKAKARLSSFKPQIIRDTSISAAKMFADNSLDFVFISKAKDFNGAFEDISEWSKKVRKGGIVAGYNYDNGLQKKAGVKRAVDRYVARNRIKPLFVLSKGERPTWFYVKSKAA